MSHRPEKIKARKRSRREINVGAVIFVIIFLYIVIVLYSYFTRKNIRIYEVQRGSIVKDETFTGFILRDEETVLSPYAGYIHFLVKDGGRASKSADIFLIDEKGLIKSSALREISDDDILSIRYSLNDFTKNFDNNDFSSLYNLEYTLGSSVSGSEYIQEMIDTEGLGRGKADEPGVIAYSTDGYEGLEEKDIENISFNSSEYRKHIYKNGDKVEESEAVCRLIKSSSWKIYFPVNAEDKERFSKNSSVMINFFENDTECQADINFIRQDKQDIAVLSINDYVEKFKDERYVSFSINTGSSTGLKIPKSSVCEKEFYIVPKSFMTEDPDGRRGFLKKILGDGDNTETEFVPTEIYRIDDDFIYLSIPEESALPEETALRLNDYIVSPNSSESYRIGNTRPLQGVYNINKGYCIFRQIVKVEENDEYVIVKANTDSGISVYDHIVLDAGLVSDGEIVYG